MKHTYGLRLVALTLTALLAITLSAGCSTDTGDSENGTATEPTATDSQEDITDGTATDSGTSANGTDAETGTSDTDTEASGSSTTDSGTTPETVTVRLYWVSAGENALGVERTLPYTQAVGTAALNALFDGPTEAEFSTWPALGSAIPENTELLGLTITNGVAKVDLSEEFESGGGSFSVTARIAQVVYTLAQFPTVDSVEFYIEGELVDLFSGEGLILDGPQAPEDYYQLLPIDA